MRIPNVMVCLVRESSLAAETRQVQLPADACEILRAIIGDSNRERFVALLLDTRNRVTTLAVTPGPAACLLWPSPPQKEGATGQEGPQTSTNPSPTVIKYIE